MIENQDVLGQLISATRQYESILQTLHTAEREMIIGRESLTKKEQLVDSLRKQLEEMSIRLRGLAKQL